MRSMFRPIKKIFTYIQKNASNGTMFGSTTSINNADDDAASSISSTLDEEQEQQEQLQLPPLEPEPDEDEEDDDDVDNDDEDDIERQIKTSIIDASKVKSKIGLPLQLQLDDELADFAHEPAEEVEIGLEDDDEDDLEEQFLELHNYPNNEIIVLHDNELNSSLASDNISEDPLAIDDYSQPEEHEQEEEVEAETETSADLLWLEAPAAAAAAPATAAKSTPIKTKEEELLRSDGGSDSGLGSEHDRHNTTTTITAAPTITTTATIATTMDAVASSMPPMLQPLRSNLKRRLDDDAMELDLSSSISSSFSSTPQKRCKRSINFDSVKIYYFPRQQGFSCVPTAGGCTLGMGPRHIAFKTMTLAEHAAELRRAHRSQNQDQQQPQLPTRSAVGVGLGLSLGLGSSSDESEESEEDYLSEGSGSDADDGTNGFLQPVTPKQRRALLKAAGIRKIDASEKIDCRNIRNSREVCGCSCREFCDPETCACSQAGIKCQVDRAMFPCGCSREACGNTVGRVEFNPTRVRTHYIHTVMRLDMEQRQSQLPPVAAVTGVVASAAAAAAAASVAAASHCYFMQPQSNYSSGYASPAYTPETSVSYYQQQLQQQTTLPLPLPMPMPVAAANTLPVSMVNNVSAAAVAQQSSFVAAQQSSFVAGYPQLDSLDSGLFASGSNATPSYGELLTPTYHQSLSYGSAQLNTYAAYPQTTPSSSGTPVGGFSSCAVPSVPPFGNATTIATNATHYQHANALETTAATMHPNSSSSSISVTSSSCSNGLARLGGVTHPADFISLSSSSRLSQINELLQHNRSTTAALVAVSEGYAAVRSNTSTTTTTIDSIDTPPIVEDTLRSCMTFEELPPPLINPTPIVAVLDHKHLLTMSNAAPQPRQSLAVSATSLTESLSSSVN